MFRQVPACECRPFGMVLSLLATASPGGDEPVRCGRLADIEGVRPVPEVPVRETMTLHADVTVVGAGPAGIGAALAAARAGASVLLVDREDSLGGTMTVGGVANWEPGPGCSFARELFERMEQIPPGILMNKERYEETLTRAGGGSIQFDPVTLHRAASALLRETDRCRVLPGTAWFEVDVQTRVPRVAEIRALDHRGVLYRIHSRMFIDCTGGGLLCQAAGCEAMLGAESRDRFGEPSAPDRPLKRLNAIEVIYRVRPREQPRRQEPPEGMAPRSGGAAWKQPSGECFVNSCGGLGPGWLLLELGYEGAMRELRQRALAHWSWLQKERLPGFEFDSSSSMLAIRESYRIVGEYVLTEQDLLAGIRQQGHDDIIAIADHPMDTHGAGGGLGKVAAPYGIPFRCLLPKGGWTNLMVACRGASFSHIAASSCRLSRTMMALGHAAGLAVAQCVERGVDLGEVDVAKVQRALGFSVGAPEAGEDRQPG